MIPQSPEKKQPPINKTGRKRKRTSHITSDEKYKVDIAKQRLKVEKGRTKMKQSDLQKINKSQEEKILVPLEKSDDENILCGFCKLKYI